MNWLPTRGDSTAAWRAPLRSSSAVTVHRYRPAGASAGGSPREQIAFGIRTCLIREPASSELDRLIDLYESSLKEFQAHPDDARQLAGDIPAEAVPEQLGALTLIGNVLLNLDEMFLKR